VNQGRAVVVPLRDLRRWPTKQTRREAM
jgi:hypothetical protein